MCGILAIINNSNNTTFNNETVEKALEKGKKRGPESSTLKNVEENITFGFHRLAINGMDNESGQPMTLDNITLICNGEIFNYKELFEKLHDIDGTTPKTHSDCEVIIHLYKRFGIEHTLRLLDGEFAFAIYDGNTSTFHYARDPFGIRPLYVLEHTNDYLDTSFYKNLPKMNLTKKSVFAVASELKVLNELLHVNNRRLYYVEDSNFSMKYGENGIYTKLINPYNIKHVLPATYSSYYRETQSSQYWKPLKQNQVYYTMPIPHLMIENENVNLKYIKQGICELLNLAVKKRVVGTSERPIACLLSGGLDSSLTTALVKKYYDGVLETYSIGMKGSEDLRHARIVAEHLKTKHHEIIVTPEEFFEAIPNVIRDIESYDTTSVRASVGNYLIGKYISENSQAKVILNGDGSDELTGGYIYMLKAPNAFEFDCESRRLLKDIYLFDVLRSDKSMSCHGLEPRTPFLDKYWVDYYLGIPAEIRADVKHNGKLIEKYLLRQSFQENEPDLLPGSILWRNKEAFSDGVSGNAGSWFEFIQKKVSEIKLEKPSNVYEFNKPKTKEQEYYREIFEKEYPNCAEIVPYFWMPKYVNTNDCSALTIKNEVYKS
jgi:asparagine synthase (glutamine-hydrolysing)